MVTAYLLLDMPRSLSDLPAELLLYILEAANDSADLFSLILTTPNFASVWKTLTITISPMGLARSIECYESALELDSACYCPVQQIFNLTLNEEALSLHNCI